MVKTPAGRMPAEYMCYDVDERMHCLLLCDGTVHKVKRLIGIIFNDVIPKVNQLLTGHKVIRCNNSMAKHDGYTKRDAVTRSWLLENLNEKEIDMLLAGDVLNITQRAGRGFTSKDYKRIPL